jgi:hypothetical protein
MTEINEVGTHGQEIPDHLPLLEPGKHHPSEGKACAMEAAAWLAGEPWTDHPRSVHPVIAGLARGANDRAAWRDRHSLWPLILASLNTARPHSPVLSWRLHHRAHQSLRRDPQNWQGAWEALLVLHAQITGHQRVSVPYDRITSLNARLNCARRPVPYL